MGISTIKPEGLPEAFTVVEKMIGEVFQCNPWGGSGRVNFVETTTGDVVVYREGAQGSNIQIKREDFDGLISFLIRVYQQHS